MGPMDAVGDETEPEPEHEPEYEPEYEMVRKVSHRRLWVWTAIISATAAAMMVPRWPVYAEGPGPTSDVAPLVMIDGDQRTYPSDGAFLITTVSQYQSGLSAAEIIWTWLDPDVSVVPKDAVLGPEGDISEMIRMGQEEMDESQIAATAVALEAALGPSDHRKGGVIVAAVAEGCPGAGRLFAGDEILEVDGTPVDGTTAFAEALDSGGAKVALQVQGGDEDPRSVVIQREACIEGNSDPVIGAIFMPTLGVDVQMSDDGIGGPSAGLAWALGIFDQLTPHDLTAGRTIAVTGALGLDGTVYPIGGIEKKVVGARDAGADVFIVPRENAGQLAEVDTGGMSIIRVDTFAEAVERLGGATLPPKS